MITESIPTTVVLESDLPPTESDDSATASSETWHQPLNANPTSIQGVVIGRITNIDNAGRPLVDFPDNASRQPIKARSTSTLPLKADIEIALMFEMGDPGKPIIIGPIQQTAAPIQVDNDDETLTLTAKRQITLRCGKASITLTRAGKVILRGAYLLSRSSGVNRIKGGSVQIN